MKQSFLMINLALVATLAGCASSLDEPPQVVERAQGPKELPSALRRAAYDAPDFGNQPPPGMMPSATASDVIPDSSYEPRVSAANGAPDALEASVTASNRAGSQVPTAPTQVRGAYQPRADLTDFDPTVTTPGRAPRTASASTPTTLPAAPEIRVTPPPPPARSTQAQPSPSADDFSGRTQSIMASATPTPPKVAATGTYGIHLASYRNPGNVTPGWTMLQSQHPDMLSGLQARAAQVDIPGKGEYIRLIVGPFQTPDDARLLCSHLKSLDEYCKVMPFGGSQVF